MARGSPTRRPGPLELSIDNHTLPPLSLSEDHWRLFPAPSRQQADTSRKMTLPAAPPPSPRYIGDEILISRNERRMEDVYRFVPQALIRRGSDSSDEYPPGLTDDQTGSSDSDASFEEERYHIITAELWNSFLEPTPNDKKMKGDNRPYRPLVISTDDSIPPRVSRPPRSPRTPRVGRPGHLDAVKEHQSSVDVSEVYVESRRSRSQGPPSRAPDFLKTLPPPPPLPRTPPRRPSANQNTWPLRSPPGPLSLFPSTSLPRHVSRPSLSTIPLPPPGPSRVRSTPNFRASPPVEKSIFEDDSDDEGGNKGLKQSSLASKLHMRSFSTGTNTSSQKPKRRSLRRSASDVIKDIFHLSVKK